MTRAAAPPAVGPCGVQLCAATLGPQWGMDRRRAKAVCCASLERSQRERGDLLSR
jgi:hypothetical protein